MGQGDVCTCGILDDAAVQTQAVGIDADAIGIRLVGQNGVGEGQCIGTTATGIAGLHRGATDVQGQARRARSTCGGDDHGLAHGHRGGDHIARVQVVVLRTRGAGDGHAADRGCSGVNRPAAGAAADGGDVARCVSLPNLHRATGVGALGQGEAGRGRRLGGTPGAATVAAVLPGCTRFHTAERHARAAGDVVCVAAACVAAQGQARCRWRGGVQGVGSAVDRAVVACGIGHLHFQGVAAGQCLPGEAPGVLSHGGGGGGPGAAVVQGHRHGFTCRQVATQGAADGLRCRLGDEVGAAACVCTEGRRGDGGGRCDRVQGVSLAVDRAVIACGVRQLHLQGVAADDGLPGQAPGVLPNRAGGRGPGAAVVQGHRDRLARGQVRTQGAADGLRGGLGDEVTGAAARVCAEGRRGDGGGGRGGVYGPAAAVAGRCRFVAGQVGLSNFHRATGITALWQGEAGGACSLRSTPVCAAVGAVLPSRIGLHTAHGDAGVLGGAIGVAAARV